MWDTVCLRKSLSCIMRGHIHEPISGTAWKLSLWQKSKGCSFYLTSLGLLSASEKDALLLSRIQHYYQQCRGRYRLEFDVYLSINFVHLHVPIATGSRVLRYIGSMASRT